jgi:ssDNA-binding Zn-finger/Zn-ribbon topoisomerase 1
MLGIRKQDEIFDEINKAWLAAFVDGEGSISKLKKNKNSWRLSIANTSRKLLQKAKKITRCGNIEKHKGSVSHWEVNRKADIHYVLSNILPYLILKRSKAIKCLKAIEKDKYIMLTCPNCHYTWKFFGKNIYPTCPKCHFHGKFYGTTDRYNLLFKSHASKKRSSL